MRAYTLAAKCALDEAGITRMTLHNKYIMTVPYSIFDNVKYIATEAGCDFLNCDYTDVISIEAVCREEDCENLLSSLTGAFGVSIKIDFLEQVYR